MMQAITDWVFLTLRWGATIAGVLIVAYLTYRVALWLWSLREREYRKLLFTPEGWFVTVVHNLIAGGVLVAVMFVWLQLGADMYINLPTIEHTFKKDN